MLFRPYLLASFVAMLFLLTLSPQSVASDSLLADNSLEIYLPTQEDSKVPVRNMEPTTAEYPSVEYPNITPLSELQQEQSMQPLAIINPVSQNEAEKARDAIQPVSNRPLLKPKTLKSKANPINPIAQPDLTKIQLTPAITQQSTRVEISSTPVLAPVKLLPKKKTVPINNTPSLTEANQGIQSLEYSPNAKLEPEMAQTTDPTSKKPTAPLKITKPKSVVYYTPLPSIAIFPVLKHGNAQAFSDVPLILAKEISLLLEKQAPGTKILNPAYTVHQLRDNGLGTLYDKMMKDYQYAGRPDPVSLNYLLARMTVDAEHPISRVFFVEADLDLNNPMAPKGFGGAVDKVRNAFDGAIPSYSKYYVRSTVQVFDTEDPQAPKVWGLNWRRSIRTDRFSNISSSVFSDADSLRAFNENAHFLGREMMVVMPKAVYMDEQVDTSVQGRLATQSPSASVDLEIQSTNNLDNDGEILINEQDSFSLRQQRQQAPKHTPDQAAKRLLNRFMW